MKSRNSLRRHNNTLVRRASKTPTRRRHFFSLSNSTFSSSQDSSFAHFIISVLLSSSAISDRADFLAGIAASGCGSPFGIHGDFGTFSGPYPDPSPPGEVFGISDYDMSNDYHSSGGEDYSDDDTSTSKARDTKRSRKSATKKQKKMDVIAKKQLKVKEARTNYGHIISVDKEMQKRLSHPELDEEPFEEESPEQEPAKNLTYPVKRVRRSDIKGIKRESNQRHREQRAAKAARKREKFAAQSRPSRKEAPTAQFKVSWARKKNFQEMIKLGKENAHSDDQTQKRFRVWARTQLGKKWVPKFNRIFGFS